MFNLHRGLGTAVDRNESTAGAEIVPRLIDLIRNPTAEGNAGGFRWWPTSAPAGEAARTLAAHELHVLLSAGNPAGTQAAPDRRPVSPKF